MRDQFWYEVVVLVADKGLFVNAAAVAVAVAVAVDSVVEAEEEEDVMKVVA